MSLSFTETTLGDEPAVDESIDDVTSQGWDSTFTQPDGEPNTQCVIDGCDNPRKAYGGRGKRPTRCEDHSAPGAARKTQSASGGRWQDKMYQQLAGALMGISVSLSAVDSFDAAVVLQGGPNFAQRVVELCETDAKAKKFVENALKGNAYFAVTVAGAAILVPILAHHRIIPNVVKVPLRPAKAKASTEE